MTQVTRPAEATHADCPRCHSRPELYTEQKTGRRAMRAHKDPVVGCSCPLGGLTIEEADAAIVAAKARLQDLWRRT